MTAANSAALKAVTRISFLRERGARIIIL